MSGSDADKRFNETSQDHEQNYVSRSTVRLSPDFVILDGFTIAARVVVGNIAERRDAPGLLADIDDSARDALTDHMLALGYRVRMAPPGKRHEPRLLYARTERASPTSTLHVAGLFELDHGIHFRLPRAFVDHARLRHGATFEGSLTTAGNVELEEGAAITGDVIVHGELTLHEHARIDGSVRAGRVSFFAEGRRTVSTLDPLVLQPVPPLRKKEVPQPMPPPAASPQSFVEPEPELISVRPPPPAVVVSEASTFEQVWPGAPLHGRYRIVAWASLQRDQVAPVIRGHWDGAGSFLEVEVLEVEGRNVSLLAHPATPRQRRISIDVNELGTDEVITTLLPVLERVSTLRVLYKDDTIMAAASVESIRWLITVFGKMLRLDTRLGRLREMRLYSLEELAQEAIRQNAQKAKEKIERARQAENAAATEEPKPEPPTEN